MVIDMQCLQLRSIVLCFIFSILQAFVGSVICFVTSDISGLDDLGYIDLLNFFFHGSCPKSTGLY